MPSKLIELVFGVKTQNAQDVERLAQSVERTVKAQREMNRELSGSSPAERSFRGVSQSLDTMTFKTNEGRRAFEAIERKWRDVEAQARKTEAAIAKVGDQQSPARVSAVLRPPVPPATNQKPQGVTPSDFNAPIQRVLGSVGLGGELANIQQIVGEVASSAGRLPVLLASVAAAAVAAGVGVAKLASSWAEEVEAQGNAAERLGFTIQQVQLLEQASKSAGVEQGVLLQVARSLTQALEGQSEQSKRSRAALEELGISTRGAFGESRNAQALFVDIASAIGKIDDPARRGALAIQIFGRSGLQVLPLLRSNLSETIQDFQRLGVAMNDGAISRAQTLDEKLDSLDARFVSIKNNVKLASGEFALFFLELDKAPSKLGSLLNAPGVLVQRQIRGFTDLIGGKTETLPAVNLRAGGGNPGSAADAAIAARPNQRLSQVATIELLAKEREDALAVAEREAADFAEAAKDAARSGADTFTELRKKAEAAALRVRSIRASKEFQRELDQAEKSTQSFAQRSLERSAPDFKTVFGNVLNGADPGKQPVDSLTLSLAAEIAKARNPEQEARAVRAAARIYSQQAGDFLLSPFREAARVLESQREQQNIQFTQLLLAANASAPALNRIRREQLGTSNTRFATDAGGALVEQSLRAGTSERRIGIEAIQRDAQFQSQRARLAQNEVAAINAAAQARIRAAEEVFRREEQLAAFNREAVDLVEAKGRRELEILEARRERELALLQLQRQQREQFAEGAGRAFDAAIAGGDGLRALARSQLLGVGRQISVNSGRIAFDAGLGSGLRLPGQGTAERPTLLGRLLQGTPFGLDPAKASTDRNTNSIDRNTASQDRLTAAMDRTGLQGGPIIGGSSVTSAASSIGSSLGIPSGVFEGARGASSIFSIFRQTNLNDPLNRENLQALRGAIDSLQGVSSSANRGNQLFGKVAGVSAGGFQILSGIQQGGKRGALQAVSGGLTVAATLDPEPVSKAILTAAAVATGLVGGLLGDPVKKRNGEIERRLRDSVFQEPVSQSLDFDSAGRSLDFDARRGRPVMVNVTIPVQTIDSKSFLDHADGLQVAVADALDRPGVLRERILGLVEER